MSEPMTHMTPAMIRSELASITRLAAEAVELLGLYEDVYADEISEEIGAVLGRIGVRGHVLRRQHLEAHERDAAFADSVNEDLDRLAVAGPQEDREDQLVREIDETGQDWNRAAQEGDQ
ncbi:hypothetical protein [Nocardiopsis sp. NPDC058789]|uniref:hypothetical protein n=1 Tax=Nocardiopsis sp. NPDC058789 TaxID=3346634 RepID=UPI00366DF06C